MLVDPEKQAAFLRRTVQAGLEFEIVLEKSGLTLVISPDRSVLEVVEDAGVMTLARAAKATAAVARQRFSRARSITPTTIYSQKTVRQVRR